MTWHCYIILEANYNCAVVISLIGVRSMVNVNLRSFNQSQVVSYLNKVFRLEYINHF